MRLRSTCILIFLFSLISGCARETVNFQSLDNKKDTVFLRNITEGYFYNKVFVESNRESRHYDEALDFSFKDEALEDWSEHERLKKMTRFDTSVLPDEWLPLYQYQGNYFIYKPGEADDKRIINDSVIVYYHHEALICVIDKFDRISSRHYKIQTHNNYGIYSNIPDNLDLYIIDPVNNIAVWKYRIKDDSPPVYSLLVAKQNAKAFPLVVNEANEGPHEFEFDPVDFKKLLKGIED